MINQVIIIRHIKAQVKEEYMDAKDLTKMDDNKLLMQYFRKHDTDKNHKLDGLELLKAIAGMEGRFRDLCFIFSQLFPPADEHHDDDEDNEDEPKKEADEPSGPAVNIEQIVPIIDSILEQDDKVITINICTGCGCPGERSKKTSFVTRTPCIIRLLLF